MTFRARFASAKRTLDIEVSKAHKEYPNGTSFTIEQVPVVKGFESFMSVMYFPLKHKQLAHLLAEFEATRTLDETMQMAFPLYADLFHGELRPLLTAEQWHDEYRFHNE